MSSKPTSGTEKDRYGMTPADWERLHALTDEEITAAALSDPDAQPYRDRRCKAEHRPAYRRQSIAAHHRWGFERGHCRPCRP